MSAFSTSEKSGAVKSPPAFGSNLRYKNLTIKYAVKEKSYFDLRPCQAQNDNHEIACSELFWATACTGGGGPVYVSRHENLGKIKLDAPLVNGHSSSVCDIAFSPFKPTLMATTSNDSTVKLWQLPQEGPLTALTAADAVVTLNAFGNSVRTANFHPSCANILACTGLDKCASIFDVEVGGDPLSKVDLNQAAGAGEDAPTITNLSFNYDGSAYALACKDNVVRIVDPRLGPGAAVVSRSASGVLGRNLRVEWCSDGSSACSALLTVSVGSNAMRTVNLWDPRNWSAPLHSRSIDTAAGQLYPMYDASAGVCYIVGKGDSIIRAFEINLLLAESESGAKSGGGAGAGSSSSSSGLSTTCEKAVDFPAAADRSTFTGVCLLPKAMCDVRSIECARLLKLTTTGVVPVSITLPRADHMKQYFQDDVFRPARSASQSRRPGDFREWLRSREGGGVEGEGSISPIMESLQPKDMIPLSQKPVEEAKPSRASSFRAAKEAEEKEAREKAETMARLTAMANTKASYHPNKSMGGGADEVDSDDNWGD